MIGSRYDDDIQMSQFMRVAEGGAGDDIIDARLVEPGLASRIHGYDAEIDGGDGNDTLIGCRGRTFARGGAGQNTFILALMSDAAAPVGAELIIADAKPDDCLLVPARVLGGAGNGKGCRLRHLTGHERKGEPGPADGRFVTFEREGTDLVIRLKADREHALVRVLNYSRGDLGIDVAA